MWKNFSLLGFKRKRKKSDNRSEQFPVEDLPPRKIFKYDEQSTSTAPVVTAYRAQNMVVTYGPIETQYNNFFSCPPPRTNRILFQMLDSIPSFRGRRQEIEKLDKIFSKNNIAVVHGSAGMGKTELARYYATVKKENYSENIIWIRANSYEDLEQSFRELSDELRLREKKNVWSNVRDVYNFFENNTALFIFDDAPDRGTVNAFLPSEIAHKHISINILITSQFTDWKGVSVLPLEPLLLDDALEVIKAVVEEENFEKEPRKNWIQLAKKFEYIPLGLQIAAAYVNEMMTINLNSFSILGYVNKLQEKDDILEEELPAGSPHSYQKNIYTALKLTLNKIEESANVKAQWGLNIVNSFVYLGTNFVHEEELMALDSSVGSVDNSLQSLHVLTKYALISRVEKMNKSTFAIRIHQLVQRFLRHHQDKKNISCRYYKQAFEITLRISERKPYESLFSEPIGGDVNSLGQSKIKWLRLEYGHYTSMFNYPRLLEKYFASLDPSHVKSMIQEQDLLFRAAVILQADVVKILLSNGADATSPGKNLWQNRTPLEKCMERSYFISCELFERVEKCILLLLNYGAKATTCAKDGQNLLHYAAWMRSIEFMKYLIDQFHLDVNASDKYGNRPLHFVVRGEISQKYISHIQNCINFLITQNADLKATNLEGWTILHYVSDKRCPELIEYLISKYNIDANTPCADKCTPLHLIMNEDIITEEFIIKIKECISLLLCRGARIDETDAKGWTLLHYAAYKRCVPLIEYLTDQFKMNVNLQDKHKQTVLHVTTTYAEKDEDETNKTKQCIDALVLRNANIHARDADGWNLLHFVAFSRLKKFASLIKYLVETYNMDINAQNCDGATPLHLVAKKKIEDDETPEDLIQNIHSMLELDAKILNDNEGWTLLHYATSSQCGEVIRYLIDDLKLDANVRDKTGCIPLHLLAYCGERINSDTTLKCLKECIRIFMSRNVSIDTKDNDGWTIMHYAAESNCPNLIEYLIDEHGMDVNTSEFNGKTPLHLVLEQTIELRESSEREAAKFCVSVLLARGAQIDVEDLSGKTPHDIAIERGYQELLIT